MMLTLYVWSSLALFAGAFADNTHSETLGSHSGLHFSHSKDTSTPHVDALFFNPSSTSSGGFLDAAARAVAQLVSSNFSPPKIQSTSPPPNDLMEALFRILGLNGSKLGAVAINALIFIAQLLQSSLTKKTSEDGLREDIQPPGSPLGWIFDNSPVEARNLVHAAKDKMLPDQLIELVRGSSSQATDCIELLICNAAPVVWSMQRYLYKPPDPAWSSLSPVRRFFNYLPTFKQMVHNSKGCDVQFPECKERYTHLK